MDSDYPDDLLSREPAPPYDGEPGFALWDYSEEPDLGRFRPRVAAANPEAPPLVWAVDTRHAPMFWFPRDCPRGCIWPVSTTTAEDRERFFGQSAASRIHVIEANWLRRIQDCRLYAYRLPGEPFRPHEVGGYWVCKEPVDAIEQVVIDDLSGSTRVPASSFGSPRRCGRSGWRSRPRVLNSAAPGCATPLRTLTSSASAAAADTAIGRLAQHGAARRCPESLTDSVWA